MVIDRSACRDRSQCHRLTFPLLWRGWLSCSFATMTRTTDLDRLGGSISPAPLLLGQMKVPNWLLAGINRINREAVDTRLLKPDAVVSEALAARLEGWDFGGILPQSVQPARSQSQCRREDPAQVTIPRRSNPIPTVRGCARHHAARTLPQRYWPTQPAISCFMGPTPR